MSRFKVSDLVAGYDGKIIIRNLSFEIHDPSFVAVVGHNGCGKSTFFKAISGQLPHTGHVFFEQEKLNFNQPAPHLVSVLEQKNNVAFPLLVKDLVLAGRFSTKTVFKAYDLADKAAMLAILDKMGIAHLRDKPITELSGGEQQMVWLAQMTLQQTPLCLLDEPTQYLDVYNKKKVFDWMVQWVNEGKIVFCITHDLHYLYHIKGFLLNLSMPNPRLEQLNPATIDKHLAWLERRLC